jgi:beta-glucosidase
VDESKARGTAVSGGWIAFKDARLGTAFTASVAKESAGAGTVEIRLGSPTGRLLGTAPVASTGDRYAYTTTTARLDRVAGRHDVYLVLGAGVRLATFRAG